MSYIFKPRRGKKTTMTSSNPVLASGEMFFEYPSTGVGSGACNVKMGNGSSTYSNLAYALGPDAPVPFTATSETSNSTLLNKMVSGASSATLFAAIKNLLSNINSSIGGLNDKIEYLNTVEVGGNTLAISLSDIDFVVIESDTRISQGTYGHAYAAPEIESISAYTYAIPIYIFTDKAYVAAAAGWNTNSGYPFLSAYHLADMMSDSTYVTVSVVCMCIK